MCDQNIPLPLNRDITVDEVLRCAKKMKNGKASGVDGVNNEMIKTAIECIGNILVKIFNKCLQLRYFPKEWCQAIITPIHKGGALNDENKSLNN